MQSSYQRNLCGLKKVQSHTQNISNSTLQTLQPLGHSFSVGVFHGIIDP